MPSILIVDDSAQLRRSMQLLLRSIGYTTHTASDGEQGIETAIKLGTEICAVLMDLEMPKVDGWSAMRTLRARGFTAPILLCTGQSRCPKFEDFDGRLVKPFTVDELLDALESVGLKTADRRGTLAASASNKCDQETDYRGLENELPSRQ